MSVFGKYSRYYDLLYQDKDYAAEAAFVAKLIEKYKPKAATILELGCGSGAHAARFGEMGYIVEGVDFSEEMLDAARIRRDQLPADIAQRLAFSSGDVRTLRLQRQFDCVISLFHVISYQATNDDLKAAFKTAREHLHTGGVFIFDCWYGPAVLTDRPVVRVKRMRDEAVEVTRIAEPTWHPNQCWIDVHYDVFIRDRASGAMETLEETHRMHYLFLPEIELLAEFAGLRIEYACEWMTEKAPDETTWGVCLVLRAV